MNTDEATVIINNLFAKGVLRSYEIEAIQLFMTSHDTATEALSKAHEKRLELERYVKRDNIHGT